jgi:regulator of replication initiation timing
MLEEYMIKNMVDLLTNPLFKMGFFEFFLKMQKEGIDAARKFWGSYAEKNNFFPNAGDIYERIVDFYIILGFVPKARYDKIVSENESLQAENKFLRDTIQELQLNLFAEGGEKIQNIWNNSIDKQLDMNKEFAKNFFELFRLLRVSAT